MENCRRRSREPHKYGTKEEQDANLAMLLDWVADQATRRDEFSLAAHRMLFDSFDGEIHEWAGQGHERVDNPIAARIKPG